MKNDRYLILKPRCSISKSPKDLLPFFETVRRISEWQALGFQIKVDEYGLPKRGLSKDYDFFVAHENDKLIADAILTGKKAINHPLPVFQYVRAGCDLNDFCNLPNDVEAFCRGNLLRINGQLEQALPFIEKAIQLNPNEVRYREVYYPLRHSLGDLSAIFDEFSCFENDIDSLIHLGRVEEWIKSFISIGDYSSARQIILKVDIAIGNLADGSVTAKFYTRQKHDWYAHKRDQFNKKSEKYLARIDKQEKKSMQTGKQKSKPSCSGSKIKDNVMIQTPFLSGNQVCELIYNFTQSCFIGEEIEKISDISDQEYVFHRFLHGPLTALEVHQLPVSYQRLIREILMQYIIFLQMNQDLPFPYDFLEGSTNEQLGEPILGYIYEHRWPFPQMLPKS